MDPFENKMKHNPLNSGSKLGSAHTVFTPIQIHRNSPAKEGSWCLNMNIRERVEEQLGVVILILLAEMLLLSIIETKAEHNSSLWL
jgi:hypothetical protein